MDLRKSMGSPAHGLNSDLDRAAALGGPTSSGESDLGGSYAPPKLVVPSLTLGSADADFRESDTETI